MLKVSVSISAFNSLLKNDFENLFGYFSSYINSREIYLGPCTRSLVLFVYIHGGPFSVSNRYKISIIQFLAFKSI